MYIGSPHSALAAKKKALVQMLKMTPMQRFFCIVKMNGQSGDYLFGRGKVVFLSDRAKHAVKVNGGKG